MAVSLTESRKLLLGLVVASALAFLFGDCVLALVNCVFLGLGGLVVFVLGLHLVFGSTLWRSERYLQDVHKKAVFITGCDTGFGHRLALRLAQMNFTVYAGCLCPERDGAEQLAKHDNIKVLKLDVTNQDDVGTCVVSVKEDLKKKDLKLWSVVNNAGIGHYSDFEFTSTSQMRRTYEVNTLGAVSVTRAFLPLLREAKEGRIVNVISILGRTCLPGLTAYSMSKHAGIAFSDGLRYELKPWNITVHTVEPGGYQTLLTDEDRLKIQFENGWAAAEPEVKAAYGNAFCRARFLAYLTKLGFITQGPHKIFEVIDDLAHAVAAETPKLRYMPHWLTKLWNLLLCLLPAEVLDLLAYPRLAVKPSQMETIG